MTDKIIQKDNFVPLYILANEKKLGPVQYMDKETLEWIKQETSYKLKSKCPIPINEKDIEIIKDFIPTKDLFLRREHQDTLHGIAHIGRVVINTYILTKMLKIENTIPYLIVAKIHDLGRINDNEDTGHGTRSWEMFSKEPNKYIKEKYVNTLENLKVKEEVEYAIKWHETNYEDIPGRDIDKESILHVLKTADALDRYRMPKAKWFPNLEFIKLKEEAKELINFSKTLTIESEELILNKESIETALIKVLNNLIQ